MLAILALVALMFVVLAVLWLANGALYLSARQKRVVALRALAEAGLQYGYWQVVFNGATPPQTFGPTTLGQGTFTVVLSDNTAQIANSYKLVSTANISGETLTFTRVIDGNAIQVQGTVFEDLNYGGGAGRSYATSSGSGVTGATVELYSAAGGYLGAVTSGSSGAYTITGLLSATTYTVRVVNSTVPSTRTGYTSSLVGVQTYRTNGSSGSAVAVTDHVGGEDPSKVDAAANSGSSTLASLTAGSATPQSITTITPASNMTGVDFGFNFDTVVNKNDTGQGSLRQAITNANALSNTGLAQSGKTAGTENLLFMLPTGSAYSGSTASYTTAFTAGIASITLASALPQITGALILDATTQSGWSSAPILEINGAGAGGSAYGLDVAAASCTIRGLIINRCSLAGIRLNGSASSGTIQCCYLGTNSAGTAASANQNGLQLYTASNQVGGTTAWQKCVLSGNTQRGLYIYGTSATGNTIQNCYIGTNASGTAAVGNGSDGLAIYAPSNTIGGTTSSARCVISGNSGNGIFVDTNGGAVTATGNNIQGCFIGTNAAGTAALANSTAGVSLGSASNVVGGTASGAGCLLSGNTQYGLLITGSGATSNVVQGNYCGTNATGAGAVPNGIYGIYINAAGSCQIGGTATGAGNLVSGNTTSGIAVGGAATGTQIQGNLIGVTLAGTAALANGGSGILVSACNSNTIGGSTSGASNVCSGNTGDGIQLTGASSSNTISGNNCGLNLAGTAAVANGGSGIDLNGATNNTVGGTAAGAGNTCSGNTGRGIYLQGTTTGNTLQGNICGLNAAGTAAVANGNSGITLAASTVTGNTIGGTTSGARNVSSGNTNYGLHLSGSSSNTVQGNYFGLNSAGTAAVANSQGGVVIDWSGASNTIGGTTSAARNTISGNSVFGLGFSSSGTGNIVQGNYIGLNAAGSAGIANPIGISVTTSSSNTIGGTSTGQGNTIAYNTNQGIKLVSGTGNAIEGNAIYSNGTLGIDISGDGVSANNGTKNSGLPNYGMDYPVFTSAKYADNTLIVTGYVGSAASQSTFASARVEIFKADGAAAANGEGQTYLGYITADSSGNLDANISVTGLAVGDIITGTATDATGNTSEFGVNVAVTKFQTPFDFAVAPGTHDLSSNKLTTGSAGANGDVYGNHKVTLNSPSAVNGDATAANTCTVASCTGTVAAFQPLLPWGAIDTAYYNSIADTVLTGNQTYTGLSWTFAKPYSVVYVNGNLDLNGITTITGTVTIVVNGHINVKNSLYYGDANSKVVFLCYSNNIALTTGTHFDGFYYAHDSGNSTTTSVNSAGAVVNGGIAGDTITIGNTTTVIHDPDMNFTLGTNMHLPGY